MSVALRVIGTLAVLLVAGSLGGGTFSTAAGPYGPSYRYCGSFKATSPLLRTRLTLSSGGYNIRVYATHMRCRKALRIQKEYWLGPRHRKVIVNGGAGATGYILLKRFPGWRCGSGAGGGACTKGRASAAYQN